MKIKESVIREQISSLSKAYDELDEAFYWLGSFDDPGLVNEMQSALCGIERAQAEVSKMRRLLRERMASD